MVVATTCGSCHTLAAAGTNGKVGPDLDTVKPSYACVVQQVTSGGAVKPPCPAVAGSLMPSFAHSLSSTQIESVAKYVSSVAGTVKGSSHKNPGVSLP
jgi:mono/diheme cytochrome c family protein